MSSSNNNPFIVCIIVDEKKNILGDVFPICISPSFLVNDILGAIHDELGLDFKFPPSTVLWKLTPPLYVGESVVEMENFRTRIADTAKSLPLPDSNTAVEGNNGVQVLSQFKLISNALGSSLTGTFGELHLHVIAQLPPSEHSGQVENASLQLDSKYEHSLTFRLPSAGSYHRLLESGAEELNSISKLSDFEPPPPFLSEFNNELTRKRRITPDLMASLQPYLDQSVDSSLFFEVSNGGNSEVTKPEKIHYALTLESGTLHGEQFFTASKVGHIVHFIYELGALVGTKLGNLRYNASWPFSLVVELQDEGKKRIYTPKSDADILFANFLYLVLEVVSGEEESDCTRMLLQASCLARFGNKLRKNTTSPFIVSAIYINGSLGAQWYQVYQEDVSMPKVTYRNNFFDLRIPTQAFEFIFRLYNFVTSLKSNDLRDSLDEVRRAMVEIRAHKYRALTTTTKWKADDGGDSGGTRKKTDQGNAFGQSSVVETLAAAGYFLTSDPEPGMTDLDPLPPSIHQAKSSSGALVCVKLLKYSEELDFLRHLGKIKSAKNHTIPLLDNFILDVGTLVILPWRLPLPTVLHYRRFPGAIRSLVAQFLEGVAFLHENGVAHLDLKPDNVVVEGEIQSTFPQLFIIDFDVSEFVVGVQTVVEGRRGTRGWIAPEVEADKDKYSAILADRWACGKMIEYFSSHITPKDKGLARFPSLLLSVDPAKRPPLHEALVSFTPPHPAHKRPSLFLSPTLTKKRVVG